MKSVTIQKLKSELKELVTAIRSHRPAYKSAQSTYYKTMNRPKPEPSGLGDKLLSLVKRPEVPDHRALADAVYNASCALGKAQYEFRHKHIAYCLVRGRTMDQIEKPFHYNKPDMKYVNQLVENLKKELENEQKALCPSGC